MRAPPPSGSVSDARAPPMAANRNDHRLKSIELDEDSLSAASRDQEQERQIAIFDLLEENYFAPEGANKGPFDLRMELVEARLALEISGPAYNRRHILSLTPFRSLIISSSATATTRRFATRPPRRSKPWTWGGAVCTMKHPSCSANA